MESMGCAPLSFVGFENLALGVVAQGADVDEAAQVELFRAEHRHVGQLGFG
jgi:hypothetical protein